MRSIKLEGLLLQESLEPEEQLLLVSKSYGWKCLPHGHVWQAKVGNRLRGDGCPICSGRLLLTGFNDVATTFPGLAPFLKSADPTQVASRTDTKHQWLLSCGHVIEEAPKTLAKRNEPCYYCSGYKVLKGFNDLASLYPEVACFWDNELNGITPDKVHSGSGKHFHWRCTLGHRWEATPRTQIKYVYCSICKPHGGLKPLLRDSALSGEWDHSKNSPQLFDTLTMGSAKKVWWLCSKKKHSFLGVVKNRARGTGCPHCVAQHTSKLEEEVVGYIESIYSGEVLQRKRFKTEVGDYKEFDIYLPTLSLAIEVNGDYWHSDKHLLKRYGITALDYHQQKLMLARKQGLKLGFLWESDWRGHRKAMEELLQTFLATGRASKQLLQLTFNE